MSSLAATQADGMYIPPSYYENGSYKKKSISQHNHDDFRGHNQFLQRGVARLELPFDGFCTKCAAIVGKGTRFNAHKAHVGDYFTTKIYEFTTRCRACGDCEFKVRTDPKERTFDYVAGIRKKVEEFDSAAAGTLGVIDTDFGNGILQYKDGKVVDAPDNYGGVATAALAGLEKRVLGHRQAQTERERTESLLRLNAKMEDDADANAHVRAAFRKERKAKRRRLGEAGRRGLGRGIELAGELPEDAAAARRAIGGGRKGREGERARRAERDAFRSVRTGSIFSEARAPASSKQKRSTGTGGGGMDRPRTKVDGKDTLSKKSIVITVGGLGRECKVQEASAADAPPTSEAGGSLAALTGCYASDSD